MTEEVESSQNHQSQTNEDLITPREHTTNSNAYCYRTPTSDIIVKQNEINGNTNFQTIASVESDRRENMFQKQFYSNQNVDSKRENENNIHI